MPCSCKILLIWIEFCWWWISFNTLTVSQMWAAWIGVGRAARVRGVCVGVSALSPLGGDRRCKRSRAVPSVNLGLTWSSPAPSLSSRGVDIVVSGVVRHAPDNYHQRSMRAQGHQPRPTDHRSQYIIHHYFRNGKIKWKPESFTILIGLCFYFQ